MLSKSIFFFFGILTLLFLIISCFSGAAIAQVDEQELIALPVKVEVVKVDVYGKAVQEVEEFKPDTFVVYGKADTRAAAHIEKDLY